MSPGHISTSPAKSFILLGVALSIVVYCYASFLLGPLEKSRSGMLASIADYEAKLAQSQGTIAKAAALEKTTPPPRNSIRSSKR